MTEINEGLRGQQRAVATSSFAVMQTMISVFIILVFLGFPGRLSLIIGNAACTLIDYLSFGLQLFLVTLASGDDMMSVKLIDLRPAYPIIYTYLIFVSSVSMMVTVDKKAELITLLHLIATVLYAIWMVERYDTRQLLEIVYCAQFIFFSITVICIVVFPKVAMYKYEGAMTFGGLFKTKNEFGTQLAFGILVQCILLRMRLQNHERLSWLFVGVLAGQFALMLLSKNFGAIIIVFTYVGYIFLYSKMKKKRRLPLGIVFVGGTIGFLVFALTILQWMEPIMTAVGKSVTLTGRVPLWQECIDTMMEKNTLTGYGFEMFWRTPSAVKAFHSRFPENSWAATTSSSMHNSVIELWCNTGLLGVALYYLMYLVAEKGVSHLEENQYLFCSSYIVMYTVRSLTERQNDPGSFYMLFQFVVICLMLQGKYKHKIEIRKKARIYDQAKDDHLRGVTRGVRATSDLAAFQKRFSNFAETSSTPTIRPARRNEPFQRKKSLLDENEKENKLESLLREFDDDDNDDQMI